MGIVCKQRSALVEFESSQAAQTAAKTHLPPPLTIQELQQAAMAEQPNAAAAQSSVAAASTTPATLHQEHESLTMMRMRQFAERQRLAKEALQQDGAAT